MLANQMSQPTSAALRAARATLCALRALRAAGSAAPIQAYMMLPAMTPLAEIEIVRRLAALPKPVACVGLTIGPLLAIGCWPEDAVVTAFKAQLPHQAAALASSTVGQSHFAVRFECPEDELTLASEEFDSWVRSYDLLFTNFVVDSQVGVRDEPRLIHFSQASDRGLSGSG